jgi:hypothetical protein
MNENEPISIREYARRKEMSDMYIRRMIKNGVITPRSITAHPKNGRPMILPLFAEEDWAMNYSTKGEVNRHRFRKSNKTYVKPKPKPGGPLPKVDLNDIPETPPPGTMPDGRKSKAELDRLHAELKVQLSAIDLRERKGQLVDKDKVYSALFDLAQELRKEVMSVPDKTIDNIRAARTRQEAHSILYEALTNALTTIAELKEGDLNFKKR